MDLESAKLILDRAPSAFVSMDEQGRITDWNARAEEMFGFHRDQAIGRRVSETIVPEAFRAEHEQGLSHFLRTGEGPMLNQRLQVRALRSDGGEFPVELTILALQGPREWSFHAFILDLSERLDAERERQSLLEELQSALHGSEQRLTVILDALTEAVTIRSPDEHLIYANRAALDRIGLSSLEQLRRADPRALMAGWETVGEDGREIRLEDLPSMQALSGGPAKPLMLRSLDRATGEERWVLLKAQAVRDENGAVEAAVTIIEDVTSAKRAAMRMEFLVRASQILASSLDYQQTLRNVAGLAVPDIADWCAVDLFDDEGGREPVAVAHVDPAKVELASRLRAFEPDELDPDQGLGLVRRTGEPAVYNDIPDELLVAAAVNEEHLGLLRAVGMRAALVAPMIARGRTIGALTLVSAESGRTFDPGDVAFVEQLAERVALAVENARLYTERTVVARTLQSSLLPDALPDVPGWDIAALYRPVGQESEVGGDFYDVWATADGWLMVIGDVTGKGVAAATVTSLVRHTAWTASEFDTRPAQVLSHIDAALKRRPALSVCTALCLSIRDGRGTIAAGGHPLLLRLGRDGVSEVGQHGTLLGAFNNVEWPEVDFDLSPGEALVAITDGVTDTVGAGEERFGMERLQEILADVQNESAMAIREHLVDELERFQVGPQTDDTAIVIMRYSGVRAGTESLERAPEAA